MFCKILAFVLFTFYTQVQGCPSGWVTHGSMCYHFSHDTETWMDAFLMCQQFHQGRLVEIDDAAENTFLEAQARLKGKNFWIAMSDAEEESTWTWMNSKTSLTSDSFTDWAPGQPDNKSSDENCVMLYTRQGYKWNDAPCHGAFNFICEKEDDSVEVVG